MLQLETSRSDGRRARNIQSSSTDDLMLTLIKFIYIYIYKEKERYLCVCVCVCVCIPSLVSNIV